MLCFPPCCWKQVVSAVYKKKKFEQASVNTQKNKKGRNVELSWAWQKIEQQFHYKMHNIQVIRVKIYHVLLIIGAEYFLQWKCCQPFLNSTEEDVR